MVEYSQTDVSQKRKKRKRSSAAVAPKEKPNAFPRGKMLAPFAGVNVYSGEGKAELWWTDFGRLVIRTFDHNKNHHADIDAIDLVRGLQDLCKKHHVSTE